ncbi:MAG: M16 family metallopeptidase [Intestinibacter sp.]|uniref:M16 family metallopeptidase n=1 Tax=Intestinibacter sp. TaxID=1965304 RepID=UPI003F14BEA7
MQEYKLSNGIKIIYKQNNSELSSICISFDAGAGRDGEVLGVAHATEHMVYKGTTTRSEKQINEELSRIFGFQNAMTNYPYVIYYGTLLNEDLEYGLELFSDILINPSFPTKGFKEEIDVIKEELKEWDEEIEQYCEDKLFFNSMENRRIKYPIIGTKESLESLSLENIKEFYNKYYCPSNCIVTVISSLEFDLVKDIVERKFEVWQEKETKGKIEKQANINPKKGYFINHKEGINSSKVQIIFPIHQLQHLELKALRIFNQYFGEGVNSVLFDTLRTKHGLVYDILTRVCHEEFINIYKITYSTSHDNVQKSIDIIKEIIEDVKNLKNTITDEDIRLLAKSFRLKKLFAEEQSVRLAKELATYDTMFGDYRIYLDESKDMENLSVDFIIDTAVKVLENMSIQVISK